MNFLFFSELSRFFLLFATRQDLVQYAFMLFGVRTPSHPETIFNVREQHLLWKSSVYLFFHISHVRTYTHTLYRSSFSVSDQPQTEPEKKHQQQLSLLVPALPVQIWQAGSRGKWPWKLRWQQSHLNGQHFGCRPTRETHFTHQKGRKTQSPLLTPERLRLLPCVLSSLSPPTVNYHPVLFTLLCYVRLHQSY